MGYQDDFDRGWDRVWSGFNKAVDNHFQQQADYNRGFEAGKQSSTQGSSSYPSFDYSGPSTPATPANARNGLATCAVYLLVYFGIGALLCYRSYQLTHELWDFYASAWALGGWFITAWVVAMIAWFVDSVVTMVKHVTP